MDSDRRPRGFGWLSNGPRNHLVAWIGEFIGTFLFLFFAFSGTQVANTAAALIKATDPGIAKMSAPAATLYIALSFGFSLAVNAWVFYRISGGLFNPAVTLALCLTGAIGWIRGIIVSTAQILGAITAAAVVLGLLPGAMPVQTSLSPDTSLSRGLFIELFATFQLVFTILMLAVEKHKGTYLAPLGIGLALFISELASVPFTGGSLNPARSFGPDVVLGNFAAHHWVYWVGPVLGAVLAVGVYRLVKVLEYETANPGQDNNDKDTRAYSHGGGQDGTNDLETGSAGKTSPSPLL